MKKICTLSLFCFVIMLSYAQTIEQVNYRGAFAPAPQAMWTEGWANWDPQNTVYPATNITVSGNISSNTTWTRNNVYQLSGLVYVDSLVTLTIEAGTVIRGGAVASNASLIIKRGAKIIAEGSPCNPIVFTSGLAVGDRSRGDWGGLIILGRAQSNLGTGFIEGLSTNPQLAYGGTDNADNSGILRYVRIELNGSVFAPNSEINGLTMGGVGSGTTIDYVQVSFNQDDAFEWFGGSVNASHLVSYRNLDDDFDTDNGFSGRVQFALAVKDPNVADNPTISTSEGFESDNDAGGSISTPQTSATFSNVTLVGPFRGNPSAVVATGFRRGARLRRNTGLKIFNSIFMDFATGLHIDGTAASNNAANGIIKFRNNIVALAGPAQRVAERNGDTSRVVFFAAGSNNDSLSSTAGILITPYNFTAPDYRPAAGSPALSNFNFNDPALPITLTRFYGQTVRSEHVLYWETSTEINNKGFQLERSVNGIDFNSIAFIRANNIDGNSATSQLYSFADRKTLNGKTFYRLRQVDKDGRTSFSSIVVLTKSKSGFNVVSIYPNPVRNQLNIAITASEGRLLTIKVNDVFGRIVIQKAVNITEGSTNYQLNVAPLANGSYFVSFVSNTTGEVNFVQSFIKK